MPFPILGSSQRWAESLISDSVFTPTPTNSTPTPLRLRTLQTLETNVVTSKSQFTLASFLVSILKFDTRLRLHQINKKRTPNPLRIRQKSPYSESNPISGFAHLWFKQSNRRCGPARQKHCVLE